MLARSSPPDSGTPSPTPRRWHCWARARLAQPELYLADHQDKLVMLDEIHRAPGLFPVLRGLIDRARRAGRTAGQYLLLGSASLDFLKQSGKSLGEGDTDTISIEPVSGRDAMIELVKHSFLLDIEAREMLMHHFGQLTELARIPMFFRLDYPRQYEMLPQMRDAVIRHATAL